MQKTPETVVVAAAVSPIGAAAKKQAPGNRRELFNYTK